jgi:hypothetical protein
MTNNVFFKADRVLTDFLSRRQAGESPGLTAKRLYGRNRASTKLAAPRLEAAPRTASRGRRVSRRPPIAGATNSMPTIPLYRAIARGLPAAGTASSK